MDTPIHFPSVRLILFFSKLLRLITSRHLPGSFSFFKLLTTPQVKTATLFLFFLSLSSLFSIVRALLLLYIYLVTKACTLLLQCTTNFVIIIIIIIIVFHKCSRGIIQNWTRER